MNDYNFGELILIGIEFKGVTQKQAAADLGITYSTFNNYVRNMRQPDLSTFIKIFRYLDIDMNQSFNITTQDNFIMNSTEAKLLKLFREYGNQDQKKILIFIENFISMLKED